MRALLQGPHGLDDISTGHPLVDSRSISEVVADLLEQPRRACRSTGATGATGPWRAMEGPLIFCHVPSFRSFRLARNKHILHVSNTLIFLLYMNLYKDLDLS